MFTTVLCMSNKCNFLFLFSSYINYLNRKQSHGHFKIAPGHLPSVANDI